MLDELPIPCHLPNLIYPYFSFSCTTCDLGLTEDLFSVAVSSSSAGIALAKLDEELKFVKLAGILLL